MAQAIYHIGFKFSHHAAKSGYDRLTDYLPRVKRIGSGFAERLMNVNVESLPRWQAAIRRRVVRFSPMEWSILPRVAFTRQLSIYHFLYAENTYKFSMGAQRTARIVCSFHQPAEWFSRLLHDPSRKREAKAYRRIDSAIALGKSQAEALRALTGRDNVVHIPYGVDTEFFIERPAVPERKRILTVGSWLRDFDMLRTVAESILRIDPGIEFVVVAQRNHLEKLAGLPNVHCLHGIPDAELLELYHTSSVLFLPLKDAVANTALLEGMSCGVPCVVTDIGSIREYASEDHAIMVSRNEVRLYTDALMGLLRDRELQRKYGKRARERGLNFSWQNVSAKMAEHYAQIFRQ